ncbi:MAG: DNA internalization-related competence protein ComEC/Rec2 [Idiomarina sp.]
MDRWLFGMLTGILLSTGFTKLMPLWQWLGYATLVLLLAAFTASYRHARGTYLQSTCILMGGIFCGICWGAGNAYLAFYKDLTADNWYRTQTVEITIDGLPELQSGALPRWQLTGRLNRLNYQHLSLPPRILLHWYNPSNNAQPKLGERWRFLVRLKPPQGLRNEGSSSYHRYLVRHKIRALATIHYGRRLEGASSVRQQLWNKLANFRSEIPFSGVLAAITLGQRQWLTSDQQQVYRDTGLAHLIAISGLHLTLVGGSTAYVWYLLRTAIAARSRNRREGRSYWLEAMWVGWFMAFGYAWLSGFAISTVRALVMWLVVALQRSFQWRVTPARTLLRAVMLVLLVDPLAWLDAGFWLSVTAVAAIVVMNWRWLPAQGRLAWLRSLWRLELWLTLCMLPITLWLFQGVAVAAPVTNLIMVPVFSFWVLPLSLLGVAAVGVGVDELGQWLWQAAASALQLSWPALRELTEQGWQWLNTDHSWWLLWGGAAVSCYLLPLRYHQRTGLAVGVVAISIVVWLWLALSRSQLFIMHTLDVGQGTAVVIERRGRALLIDTGLSYGPDFSSAERVIIPLLRHRQLRPDFAVVSHTDADHAGGQAALQRAFPQLEWLGAGGKPCIAGMQGRWQDVSWQVLHPQGATAHDKNNDSCVLLVQYKHLQILLPGDAERRAEATLVGRHGAKLNADILLIPHHGSRTSSTEVFLQSVSPSLAIVSRAVQNRYGFPHPDVSQRYQKLGIITADTALGGQLQVVSDGLRWWLQQPKAAQNGRWYDANY